MYKKDKQSFFKFSSRKAPEIILAISSVIVLTVFIVSFIVFRTHLIKKIDEIIETNIGNSLETTTSVIASNIDPQWIRDIEFKRISSVRASSEDIIERILISENLNNAYIVDSLEFIIYSSNPVFKKGSINPNTSVDYVAFTSALYGTPSHSRSLKIKNHFYRFAYAPVKNEFGDIIAVLVIEADNSYADDIQSFKSLTKYLTLLILIISVFLIFVIGNSYLTIKRLRLNLQKTAALAAVSRMTASIAHEIRNPLQIILSSARRMSKSDDRLRRDVYMSYISDEIERLSGITDNYLSIIRQDKKRTKISTASMIKMLETTHEGELISRNIDFKVSVIDDVEMYVSKNSFMHVTNNLVRNSMESIRDEGKIRITQQLSIDGKELSIDISDTGIGFEKKHHKKIFEPFFTTKEDGTGLGLYICKLLVESDNGKISAKRKDDLTTFTITYPVVDDEE